MRRPWTELAAEPHHLHVHRSFGHGLVESLYGVEYPLAGVDAAWRGKQERERARLGVRERNLRAVEARGARLFVEGQAVEGFAARGGFAVDCEWENGTVTAWKVRAVSPSSLGKTVRVLVGSCEKTAAVTELAED